MKYEDFNQKDDGIRAGILDENYRDADSEKLMIDVPGKGSTIFENELAALFCVLLCNEQTYERAVSPSTGSSMFRPRLRPSARLATKIDKRVPDSKADSSNEKDWRKKFLSQDSPLAAQHGMHTSLWSLYKDIYICEKFEKLLKTSTLLHVI